MGLFDFVKDAGEKLLGFGGDEPEVAEPAAEATPAAPAAPAAPSPSAGVLHKMLMDHGLAPDDLSLGFSAGTATVKGTVESVDQREKIIVALGNVRGVARVDDQLEIEGEAPEPTFYTVKPGDTLSGIARSHYGNAMKYPVIFEANKPMLSDPDRIYPGQVLRIPPLED